MYIYADILVLLNLFMNAVIFLATGKVAGIALNWKRIMCGSLCGALITIAMFLPVGTILRLPLVKIIVSIFLVGLVFYPIPWRRLPLVFSVFYLVSFMLGGLILAMLYFMDASSYVTNGVFTSQHASWVTLGSGAVVLLIWGHWLWGHLSTRLWQQKYVLTVKIHMSGKFIQLTALMDSGNSLRDPISRIPVAIAEYAYVKSLLPMELSTLFDKSAEEDWVDIMQHLPYEIVSRLHIIPFSSVGRNQGLLIGFKPDFLEFEENGNEKFISTVIVGMCKGRLSGQGEYHALLHPELVHGAINHKKEAS